MKIINGKELAEDILNKSKKNIKDLKISPILKILLVGEDPASQIYVRSKIKACEKVGIECVVERLDDSISEDALLDLINENNKNSKVTTILVQLPLPDHINSEDIVNAINVKKDVDGLNDQNTFIIPATAKAVMYALKSVESNLKNKNVVVLGRSKLVGAPVAELLKKEGCVVNVCHSQTPDISVFTKQADIIVSAVGKKGLVTKNMVKEDVIIIDVGINRVDGKLYGDVDRDVFEKASFMTPVPGGIGPMTVACLIENVLACFVLQN